MKKIVFGKKEIDLVSNAYLIKKPAVLPTDTIYGITVPAFEKKAVLNLYKLRKRDYRKPFIILISSLKDLSLFGVKLDTKRIAWLKKIWPQNLTVIVPCDEKRFNYLHRDKGTLAFRLPDDKWLIRLIKTTGPIVAPSANIEGQSPAETVSEAYEYFGDKAVYLDGGKNKRKSSTIVSLENNSFKIIRQGGYKLKKNEYFRPNDNN
ncbi:MAG: L-threonylcarbamoyladenylate synthase [Candidatus Paceibacterota bacterium]